MVDLNLWRLEYDAVLFDFGTHESGHPFTEQVRVSTVDLDTDDLVHPLSDGLVFGVDYARGRALEFTGAHLSTAPQPWARRWRPVMDDAQEFERAWRARSVRAVAGKVAKLSNLDRGRMVYGRPRPYVPNHDKVRQGWLTYGCAFVTVDDRFYSTTEKVVVAGVDPGSAAAFTFPAKFPLTGVAPSETRAWVVNDGTDDSWPIVTFRRGGHPRLELLNDSGGVEWALEVNATLNYDEKVVVDTRPWVRTVKRNGTSTPGLLVGDALDKARIRPGAQELRLIASDPTGTAEVQVQWRDAFGSL